MRKKVLLLGKSGSGKSSMRSIVFSNYVAKDTRRLGATIDVEHSHIRFLGNMVLNLWDCGGQDVFMEDYLSSQRDYVFRNVEILIYVFDVGSRTCDRDLRVYVSCLEAIREFSPKARLFCLFHKMDLVHEEMRHQLFLERERITLAESASFETICLPTSIWDESLYRAWSSIIYTLIPNISMLERHLSDIIDKIGAYEIVLFEKTTFLNISNASTAQDSSISSMDPQRFEKISNIVKQFKMSCSKIQGHFSSLSLKTASFTGIIAPYTGDTYILVVSTDQTVRKYDWRVEINNKRFL